MNPEPIPCSDDAPELQDLVELTDEEALTLIRRYNAHHLHAETIKANAAALIKAEEAACARILEAHGAQLQAWAAGRLRGRARSVRTLEGVAGFRSVPARFVVTDPVAALAFAEAEAPEAIVRSVDPKKLGVNPYDLVTHDANGELVWNDLPGIQVVPEREVFYVKPGTPKPGEE